jgi:glycosyltransferase involved in cell wall biosynthesis
LRLTLDEIRLSDSVAKLVDDDLDVLNVHEMFVLAGAAKWKKRTGKPVFWMMNEFPGALAGSRFFKSSTLNNVYDFLNGIWWVAKWYERAIRTFDGIAVLDDNISRKNLEDRLGLKPVTVRSGLDVSQFSPGDRCAWTGGRQFEILSNAIIFPHRRLEDIVGALRILKCEGLDFRWRHIGTWVRHPDYKEMIDRKIMESGISGEMEFLGSVSEEELVRLYRCADAFLFPSTPQTWGLVVFEAMACGVPVVVSRGAGASEIITDGETGLLVDSFSPDQIACAIRSIADSPKLWKKLSEHGRYFVGNNITWEIYARKMRNEMARCVEHTKK